MKVFSHSTWPTNAINEYRIHVPLQAIEKYCEDHGEEFELSMDQFHHSTNQATRLFNFHKSDIVQTHAAIAVQVYETYGAVQAAIPIWHRFNGMIKTTPAIVVDVDDLYHEVGYTNPSFGFWGVHRPDGGMLEPGDEISVDTDDGPVLLWKDGQEMSSKKDGRKEWFSVEENHKRIATFERLMREADLVTFSTQRLRDAYANKYGIQFKNSYVYNNSISVKEWQSVEMDVVQKPEVRILWQGGWSHADDMLMIRDSVAKLARKHPNTKWIIFGHRFKWFEDAIPEAQLERITWVPYESYKLKLSSIGFDINMAPLYKSLFTECKSAIKFYEASMLKNTPVTIASAVGPFADDMKDGETGMLFDTTEEFEAKMELLIANTELRKKLGEAGRKWVIENRSLQATTPGLYEAYKEVSAKVKRDRRHYVARNKENTIGLLSANYIDMGTG